MVIEVIYYDLSVRQEDCSLKTLSPLTDVLGSVFFHVLVGPDSSIVKVTGSLSLKLRCVMAFIVTLASFSQQRSCF